MRTARAVLDELDLTEGLRPDLLADDLVVRAPMAAEGRPRRIEGRAAFLDHAEQGRANLPLRLDGQRIEAVHDTADPEVLVVEYELTGTGVVSGRRSTASFVAVLRVRDGLIADWCEYQDTAAVLRAVERETVTTRGGPAELVRRLQECFNARRFTDAAELFDPAYLMHPMGTVGFETGPWRQLVAQYPEIRVVADHVLVDGDRVTACSSVDGCGTPPGEPAPMLIEVFRVEGGRFVEWWGSTWQPRIEWAETPSRSPDPHG